MLAPCLPSSPPKSLPRQPSARISELDWVSQEYSLHTIPVTISNKARQGEGWDAPWHLNQLLSFNNSMIFNPSLLLSSLQYLKQHTGFYHDWEKHQQMNEFLNICPGIWAHLAEIGTLTLIELNAVMLLVLKFKQSSSSECQLFVNVSHRDLYLHTPCLTVCAKKRHRCVWIPKVSECMFYHSQASERLWRWGGCHLEQKEAISAALCGKSTI